VVERLRGLGALILGNSSYEVIDDQHDDSADNGDEHAPKIEAGDPRLAEPLKKPAADHSSDDPEQDINEEPLPPAFHDLAGDEACDQSEDDPAED
jgi:hypothetical protein